MVDRTGRDNFVKALETSKAKAASPEWLDDVMELSHKAWIFYSLLNDFESKLLRAELERANKYCRSEIQKDNPEKIPNLIISARKLFLRIQGCATCEKARMPDEEEKQLRENIESIKDAPKSELSDIIFDLRLRWDTIFASESTDSPTFPRAGRKEGRDPIVKTLAKSWSALTVYERGLLMEDVFQLTSLSREDVHQVLSAVNESLPELLSLLDENWKEIQDSFNLIDPARISCLKIVFEKYWTRPAKPDEGNPFVEFNEAVLAVKGSDKKTPNPRRALEKLKAFEKLKGSKNPLCRGSAPFSYISLPKIS